MNVVGNYRIREGRVEDCSAIAYMINEASEDAVNYLLKDSKSDKSPITLLAEQLANEVHYSYANTLIAEIEQDLPMAMALSFPASGLILDESLLQNYSASKKQYLKYFCDNRINDSWHLDAIYVATKYRHLGLGQKLLGEVKQRARYYKFPTLQVFVFGSNKAAVQFYQRNDFIIDREIQVDAHEFLKHKHKLLRMRCEL